MGLTLWAPMTRLFLTANLLCILKYIYVPSGGLIARPVLKVCIWPGFSRCRSSEKISYPTPAWFGNFAVVVSLCTLMGGTDEFDDDVVLELELEELGYST